MKIVIDIPKYVYDATKTIGNVIDADNEIVAEAIANGTPIPDNVTNGDIMNLMFDIVEDKHPDKGTINLYFFDLDIAIVVSLAWWNAPYQKGGKG